MFNNEVADQRHATDILANGLQKWNYIGAILPPSFMLNHEYAHLYKRRRLNAEVIIDDLGDGFAAITERVRANPDDPTLALNADSYATLALSKSSIL